MTEAPVTLPRRYQSIQHALKRTLIAHRPAGGRLPPIKDMARLLGAGLNNTHRAVRELVREGILRSKPGVGTFIIDDLMLQDADIQSDSSQPMVLKGKRAELVYHGPEGLLERTIVALSRELARRGCSASPRLVPSSQPIVTTLDPAADILVSINPNPTNRIIPAAPDQRIAVISTAIEIDVDADNYDVIGLDSEQGGRLAGRRMREIGCRAVCFIGRAINQAYDHTSGRRLAGLECGFGAPLRAEHRLRASDYITEAGARAVQDYLALKNRPEGVFCASDELAVGFVHGALGHGLEPGRDYQIIGFDGQSRGRQLLGGPLSTIDSPMEEMARVAVLLVTDRIAHEVEGIRKIDLSCKLFPGATAVPSPADPA